MSCVHVQCKRFFVGRGCGGRSRTSDIAFGKFHDFDKKEIYNLTYKTVSDSIDPTRRKRTLCDVEKNHMQSKIMRQQIYCDK